MLLNDLLNDIDRDIKKILGDKINKTVKFHRLERSMDEAMSKFHILYSSFTAIPPLMIFPKGTPPPA